MDAEARAGMVVSVGDGAAAVGEEVFGDEFSLFVDGGAARAIAR